MIPDFDRWLGAEADRLSGANVAKGDPVPLHMTGELDATEQITTPNTISLSECGETNSRHYESKTESNKLQWAPMPIKLIDRYVNDTAYGKECPTHTDVTSFGRGEMQCVVHIDESLFQNVSEIKQFEKAENALADQPLPKIEWPFKD